MAPTPLRHLGRVLALGLVLLVVTAAPASADPSGPSDFRSEVTGIVPDVEGLAAEILGGDSFLQITVEPGHTAVVEGYNDEPYIQVLEDGTVQRNRLSAATYVNDDRRGGGAIPTDVTEAIKAGTEPDWETVAGGGTYAWHDHRVHWMGVASPPIERGQAMEGEFDPWRVPVIVDGTAAEIQGSLFYEEAVSPLPWAAVAIVAAGALAWFGRGRGLRLGAAALAVVSAAAVVVGRADWASTPDGGGNPLLWALPVVALLAAVGAVVLAANGSGLILALASVASLSGWAIFRVQVLLKPVLPTALPFVLDRTTVALAFGVSVAVAYLAVTSGALTLPALEDD